MSVAYLIDVRKKIDYLYVHTLQTDFPSLQQMHDHHSLSDSLMHRSKLPKLRNDYFLNVDFWHEPKTLYGPVMSHPAVYVILNAMLRECNMHLCFTIKGFTPLYLHTCKHFVTVLERIPLVLLEVQPHVTATCAIK